MAEHLNKHGVEHDAQNGIRRARVPTPERPKKMLDAQGPIVEPESTLSEV